MPIYVFIKNIMLDVWEIWSSEYPNGTYRNCATMFLFFGDSPIGSLIIKGDHTAESWSINSVLQKYFEGRKVVQISAPI